MPPLHPVPPLLPVDGLALLAEIAEGRLADDLATGPAASLLRVRVLAEEVELGWLALQPDRHPVDELVGTTSPPDWWAIGVAATGTAHHLDSTAPPLRVRTVHLVARDGSWASRWRPLDDDGDAGAGAGAAAAGCADEPDRPVGRIDDVCRRALGLPTPAPAGDTAVYWAQRWLDAVLEAASARRRPTWGWVDVARRHPAYDALATGAPGTTAPAPAQLARMARRLAAWRDWPVVRRGCAAGTWPQPDVTAEVAGWLDDGAFARWAGGAYPDLDDLRAAVADLLPPRVAVAVETTLLLSGVVAS